MARQSSLKKRSYIRVVSQYEQLFFNNHLQNEKNTNNIKIWTFSGSSLSFPSVKELIVDENDEQFTDLRWSLFQWLINSDAETISKIRTSSDSKYIRIVRFTLKLLLSVSKNSSTILRFDFEISFDQMLFCKTESFHHNSRS